MRGSINCVDKAEKSPCRCAAVGVTGGVRRRKRADLRALPRSEEKGPIRPYRAAERESILIALQPVVPVRRRSCVHSSRRFAGIQETAVKTVAAGARDYVDNPTAAAGELGAVVIRLKAEFLNRVRIWQHIRDLGIRIFVDSAIENERSRIPAPAAGRNQFSAVSGRVAAWLKVPGADRVPGVSRSSCITFRPFSGRSFIIFSVMTVFSVAPRVSTGRQCL